MCAPRHILQSIFFLIIAQELHAVDGGQIVLAVDNSSQLTVDLLAEFPWKQPDSNFILYKADADTTAMDILLAGQKWLADDNQTVVVDLTNDCRLAAFAAVMRLPLVRASVVDCSHVNNRSADIRPTLATYVLATFTVTPHGFGSCLARVVLLTEYATDITNFPRCATSAAVPLLVRVVGAWPVSELHILATTKWLAEVASKSASHYVIVIGKTAFLEQILQEVQPGNRAQSLHWVFATTDGTWFDCQGCPELTTVIVHSRQYVHQQFEAWTNRSGLSEMESDSLRKGIELAFEIMESYSESRTLYLTGGPMWSNFSLDFYSVDDTKSLDKLGRWTSPEGLEVDSPETEGRCNPSIITVATLHAPPFVFRTLDENGTAHYTGYAVDVWTEIASFLNLTYKLTEPHDKQFGVQLDNGTWTGMIGMIVSGAADLAVGPLTVSAERDAVVDFTTPFYEFAGITILMQGAREDNDLLFFVTVFSKPMWAAWLAVLLLTGLLLAVFDYVSPYSARNAGKSRDAAFDVKEGLWLVAASFTLSGPERTPRTLSSRILVAGFWFFCSTTMANYTANLAAFLTTSRLTTSINSLTDLTRQSAVQYSVVSGTSVHTYFERMALIEANFYEFWKNISSNTLGSGQLASSDLAVWEYPLGDTYVKAWSDIQRYGLLQTSQQGLEHVLAGGFALIDDAPFLEYHVSRRCGLATIGKQFSTRPYALALLQGSPLTERISNVILDLQSKTKLEELKHKWWRKDAVDCSTGDDTDGLSLHTLGGVFLMAAVGVLAGLMLCVLEMCWKWMADLRAKKATSLPGMGSQPDTMPEQDLTCSFDSVTNLCREDHDNVVVSYL